MLSSNKSTDGVKLSLNVKSLRKILMTKPGIEPRTIEVKVGRVYPLHAPSQTLLRIEYFIPKLILKGFMIQN